MPFSNTGLGVTTTDVTPDYDDETFTINVSGTYQIDWNVYAAGTGSPATCVSLSSACLLDIMAFHAGGVSSGTINVALQPGDVLSLVNPTTAVITTRADPLLGATISITRVD